MRRPRTRWPRTRWPRMCRSECLAPLEDRRLRRSQGHHTLCLASDDEGRKGRSRRCRYCLEDGRSCGEPPTLDDRAAVDSRRSGRASRDLPSLTRSRSASTRPPVPWTRSRWCWTAGSRGRPRILLEHSCRPTRASLPQPGPSRGGEQAGSVREASTFAAMPCPALGAVGARDGTAARLRGERGSGRPPIRSRSRASDRADDARTASFRTPGGRRRWRSALDEPRDLLRPRASGIDRGRAAPVRELRPVDVDLRWRGVAAERRAQDADPTFPTTTPSRRSARSRGSKRDHAAGPALDLAMEADGRHRLRHGRGGRARFDASVLPPPPPDGAHVVPRLDGLRARRGPESVALPWRPPPRESSGGHREQSENCT